jgi:hypothetical protein
MKNKNVITLLGLLLFFLLCLVPVGYGQQQVSQTPGTPWQLGLSVTFTANSSSTAGFNVSGLTYWRVIFVPSGTVSACSLSLDSSSTPGTFSTGGILAAATIGSCASAGMYITTNSTTPTIQARLTPTITGTGSVTVVLFGYTDNPAAGGGGTSSNVNVQNFPSSQPVSQNGTWTVQPGNTQNTTPWLTQPAGFSSVVAFQQAVTASAVVLATNTVHGFCVKALPTNSITVYVGPSGVTTSTGYPLAAGDSICYQASNTNLAYVIASATGASVAVSGN